MTADDYDAVYSLWLSCAGMGLNSVDDSREGIAKFLGRNPETCFVALERLGITKAALVAFGRNRDGNAFWERLGFTERQDIIYRNKDITETKRIDT